MFERNPGGAQALQLASKIQTSGKRGVVQRFLPEPVPHQHQRPLARIPNCAGKHPAQALNTCHAFLFVQVNQHLRIALRAEPVSAASQGSAQVAIIVDLAVEHHPHGSVFVRDGLPAHGQIDDAEAPHAHAHAPVNPVALVIRAAMPDLVAHRLDLRQIGVRRPQKISGYSAHRGVNLFSRAWQELVNVILIALPPNPASHAGFAPRLPLPVATELAGSESAQQTIDLANQIQSHQFPVFGMTIDTGREIRWRRDYLRGIETGLVYFRRIPYLNSARSGDHKVIWELNRHQHLPVLARAYGLTGDARYLDEIRAQLESWIADNPFHRGTNWASALEVAFRALSWIWVYHLVGPEMPSPFRARWLHMLYLHGCHLANNLSFYFSPNNHLVGEALALHALGLFFAGQRRAAKWEQVGARVMREQMDLQIRPDGSSFEQSMYYQGYLLDMFVLHAILARPGPGTSRSWTGWPSFCMQSPDLCSARRCWGMTTAGICRWVQYNAHPGQGSRNRGCFPTPASL